MSRYITVKEKDEKNLLAACQEAADAAYGDSNDKEMELLRDALEFALGMLGLGMPDGRDPEDDE